jgi:hypothetical protein
MSADNSARTVRQADGLDPVGETNLALAPYRRLGIYSPFMEPPAAGSRPATTAPAGCP